MYVGILAALFSYFFAPYVVIPILNYSRDPKGLRCYPNFYTLSSVSDLPYIYEAHKEHPVLRVGPNSLFYDDPQAIKDIYGHGTACVKGRFYSETGGSHAHLADVGIRVIMRERGRFWLVRMR